MKGTVLTFKVFPSLKVDKTTDEIGVTDVVTDDVPCTAIYKQFIVYVLLIRRKRIYEELY